MNHEIESGIPVPEKAARHRWKNMVSKMKPGDSVIVMKHSEAGALGQVIKDRGFGYAMRKQESGVFRVWLLEKEGADGKES